MGRIKNLIMIGAIAFTALGVIACDDPLLLLKELEIDVMTANALYLEVISITPDASALNVNPGDDIRITFDRPIDDSNLADVLEIVDDGGILFTSSGKSLDYSFDTTSNILTVSANPYFDGLATYTIRLKDALIGIDGSSMFETGYEWNFSTKDVPIGTINIDDIYTNDDSVNVTLTKQGATYYAISHDRSVLEDYASAPWTSVDIAPGPQTIDISSEGTRTLYAIFRDGANNEEVFSNKSEIVEDTVVYDITPPTVDIDMSGFYDNPDDALYYFNSYDLTSNPTVTGDYHDDLSGFGSAVWTKTSGAGTVVFGSSTSLASSVELPAGLSSVYTLTLTVTDGAGNEQSVSQNITRDTVVPSAPTVSASPASPTTDRTPTYSSISGETNYFRYKAENGSWDTFSTSSSYSPTVPYGDIDIAFQCRDDAGNWSSSTTREIVVYPRDIKGSPAYSPSNNSVISGDLAWTVDSSGLYYDVYLGLSPSSMSKIGDAGVYRPTNEPFVDTSDFPHFLINRTYYWKVNYYDRFFITGRGYVYALSHSSSDKYFRTTFGLK